MGSAAALAERGDFGHSSTLTAKTLGAVDEMVNVYRVFGGDAEVQFQSLKKLKRLRRVRLL
jgi:hypothetical protein